MTHLKCSGCGKIRELFDSEIKLRKSDLCKCCSQHNPSPLKGTKFTQAHKDKISAALRGEKHQYWKGDAVGYKGLHDWVSRNFGKPKVCQFCKSTTEKKYEWANISKKYKRDRNDWIRLCVSCHDHYDRNLSKASEINKLIEHLL